MFAQPFLNASEALLDVINEVQTVWRLSDNGKFEPFD